ncbi:phosphoribosyltransferase-like protein [Thorsellia anophelis]|uniref:PRTase-CE domain-containing protein n=1 Tax=Thorsellia anophelis DSM 18579 TaxID=1123402 RepID=A0A1I0FW42_9GAMM|nr:hypothetical protein [Thorsellia anophelis]SET62504.1 hypothetical protein SAMN02583745_02911 [Thorsellia anophelis DSM 18579]
MNNEDFSSKMKDLILHSWDEEIKWSYLNEWINNFNGQVFDMEIEQQYARYILTKFIYFSKPMIREMLKSLYRDYFASPIKQEIRKLEKDPLDFISIKNKFEIELSKTKFIGIGNPSESGAHLLYYFRQVNKLKKDFFADLTSILLANGNDGDKIDYIIKDKNIERLVFFDDIVGSGSQIRCYLGDIIKKIRIHNPHIKILFFSLFSSSEGLILLNNENMFNGKAFTIYELDKTYRLFDDNSRFINSADSLELNKLKKMIKHYGDLLSPKFSFGWNNSQLLIAFSHNTPDNVPIVFWADMKNWKPAFKRFGKEY